ncbi:MAG: MmgE/PrpD family protein [Roseomonas sp.]|nr:MmgE/PrpD family protein [Roseomonas sp.]MCA3327770.1 MmgE/PrpD family protein [Roseomonas sp.]MCA3329682.1 MmgE/PrpD family protein [Roseomonas sp.]MCA3334461.1 MmgE/PrpD family protein [Roseomonas sp.]MCA3347143.1 MmgE/PrpD family protein [Roseomonas sp.]
MKDAGDFDDVIAFAWDGPAGAAAQSARLLLLDSLGCMIAGLGHTTPRAFAEALAITMPGAVRLPGCGAGLAEAGAAAALAAAMCWDEANEGLARAHGRPGLAVAPLCIAALAAGRVSARAAHDAFALGYEIAARAGEIWRIRPGMHVDGSWHALGAAAAAARLAGGDAAEVARAVRLAACQIPFALYAPIAAGMDGRNSYPAHAVLLGAMAAAAARAGMDAPADGLVEARRIALLHETPARRAPAGEWLIEQAYIKPFAGVRHAHYAAAAALELRAAIADRLADVAALRLETYAEALRYAANRAPARAIQAQFSLSWAVAAALMQGDLGPAAYTDAALADPALRRLEALVELSEDTALTKAEQRGARLTATLANGESHQAFVSAIAGDPGLALDAAAVMAKCQRFAAPVIGDTAMARLAAMIMTADGTAPRDFFGAT